MLPQPRKPAVFEAILPEMMSTGIKFFVDLAMARPIRFKVLAKVVTLAKTMLFETVMPFAKFM
jgi:hypothetical protein